MTSDLPKHESRIKELSDILTKSVQINPYKDPYKELKLLPDFGKIFRNNSLPIFYSFRV